MFSFIAISIIAKINICLKLENSYGHLNVYNYQYLLISLIFASLKCCLRQIYKVGDVTLCLS